jgi:hypothetical protein
MLFMAETAFVIATRRRRAAGEEAYYISNTSAVTNSFSVSSGISLGQKVTHEIEDLGGVRCVEVKQSGVSYAVRVVMETIDFENFQKVVAKELELSDRHPEMRFDFDIDFAPAEESNLELNAA